MGQIFREEFDMADNVTITIRAKTMEGLGAVDPQVTVDIFETSPMQRQVVHTIVANFNSEVQVVVPSPDGFPVWQVNVSFSRFDAVSGFLFQPRGNPSPVFLVKLARLPGKWTPQFTALNALASPRFDLLRKVLSGSTNVDLKKGDPVGDLNAKYDALAETPQILGKTALLNLFAVLCDERDPIALVPWFNYVKKIVRIDQERFVAEVDPTLFENVLSIVQNLNGVFSGQGYSTEPQLDFLLHYGNIPPQYDVQNNLQQMTTVKKRYQQGDLQLTVSYLRVGGNPVHLLDCDMDEHDNIVAHGFDLLKHLINGGTSPIAMHEYIEEDSAQATANHVATIDLGYQLV
jgi:hypothetical protein